MTEHGTTTPQDDRPLAIVISRYNRGVTDRLLDGAVAEAKRRGETEPGPAVIDAPGAFELAAIAARVAETGAYQGIVCLGCVIKGDTRHDEYINAAVANALADISVQSGIPAAFGVITAENAQQARDRAGGTKGNKGEEAMSALLDTLAAFDAIDAALEAGTPANVARTILGSPADKADASAGTEKHG
ncbi:MAG: 6,7-dimethyl-8-ribityllumazine synthase [Planctomycetota bacterium]